MTIVTCGALALRASKTRQGVNVTTTQGWRRGRRTQRKPKTTRRTSGSPLSPVRRPQVPRADAPRGAPAQHAAVTILRTDRINNCFSPICIVPIPAPLPDIATHIVEPPGIRGFLAGRLHFVIGVSCMPGVAVQCCRIITKKPSGRCPRTAGVFPFGLSRQAIAISIRVPGNMRTVDTITELQPHLL